MTVPVSVLLLTLNEEQNLPRCLAALDWCDDVVVIDSFSSDRTVEIARESGARVVQRAFDDFAGQRNYGLEEVEFRHEWILHIDADEVVTRELVDAMREILPTSPLDAYRLPSKLMFSGRWLRHAGMYPTYQVRLTRQGAFRFRQVGHGQKEDVDPGRVGTIDVPYLHYAFSRGLEEWFAKHNRYSTVEAREIVSSGKAVPWRRLVSRDAYMRRQALRLLAHHLPFRPLLRFLYMYLFRLGFLDGRPGLDYCWLLASYEVMISTKVRGLRRKASNDVTAADSVADRAHPSDLSSHPEPPTHPE